MALIWAAGFIWLAVEVAGPDESADNSTNVTDVTGTPVTAADEKAIQDALNSL